jgi:hypothetical protein
LKIFTFKQPRFWVFIKRLKISADSEFQKKIEGLPGLLKEVTKESKVQSRFFDHFFEFFKNQNGLFDVLRIADQSSTYLTITHCIFLGKSVTNPSWLCKLSRKRALLKTTMSYTK